MSDISDRILHIIEKNQVTYRELAKLTGIPRPMLQRYATGETAKIPMDRIQLIANALGVSAAYLMGWEDDESETPPQDSPNIPDNIIETKSLQRKTVPLLGPIAAGKPVYMDDTEQVYIPMDDPTAADFALRVEGDSMEPLYEDGDMVYLRQVDDVDDGQIAAVIIDDSATLKRVYHGMSSVTLASENPAYPPMLFTARDHDRISIIGEPVGFLRMRKK